MLDEEPTRCPVCGFTLAERPWKGLSASNTICPSCGIHFGYDDAAGGDIQERVWIYAEWRKRWIGLGKKWFSKGVRKPVDWDPLSQLIEAESNPGFGINYVVNLVEDLPEVGLRSGDRGVVVALLKTPRVAYEIEFCDGNGRSLKQIALLPSQIKRFEQ